MTSRFEVNEDTGCWIWTGAYTGNGYGAAYVDGKPHGAHRFMWEHMLGKTIPPGMLACHRCDNTRCVWPGHIFIGTPGDNTRDALVKGRLKTFRPPVKERCKHNHTLADAYVRIWRGYRNRHCRTCTKIRYKEAQCQKRGK